MNVLFIGNDASRTGAPIGLLELLRWLKRNTDWQFSLVLRRSLGPLLADYEALCPVICYDQLWNAHGPVLRLARKLGCGEVLGRSCLTPLETRVRGETFDLIYCNTITNGGILGDLSLLKVPMLCHVHELESVIRKYGSRNLRMILRHSQAYIADSRAVAESMVRHHGVASDLIPVVHEWVDVADIQKSASARGAVRRRLGYGEETRVVGGCGYSFERKGKDLFVDMARRVLAMDDAGDVRFLWIGGDSEGVEAERFEACIAEAGLQSRIRIVHDTPDAHAYMAAMDVFALTSREEPLGIVCLETACLGCPTVCFAGAGGAPEFVEGDAGVVVPFPDTSAMAAAIQALLADNNRRQQYAESGLQKVKERFAIEKLAPRIVEIAERVARGGGRDEDPIRGFGKNTAVSGDVGRAGAVAAPS